MVVGSIEIRGKLRNHEPPTSINATAIDECAKRGGDDFVTVENQYRAEVVFHVNHELGGVIVKCSSSHEEKRKCIQNAVAGQASCFVF